jgi:hypothetical protein
MKIKIVFWYPCKIMELVSTEIEVKNLIECFNYLSRYGLNVLIPKNFGLTKTVYVDEKMFTTR